MQEAHVSYTWFGGLARNRIEQPQVLAPYMYSRSSQAATSMWSSSGTTSGHGLQQWLCDWNCSTTMKAAAVLLGLLFTSRVPRAVPTPSSSQAHVPLWVLGSRVPQLLLLVVPSIFPLSIFRFSDRFFLLLCCCCCF